MFLNLRAKVNTFCQSAKQNVIIACNNLKKLHPIGKNMTGLVKEIKNRPRLMAGPILYAGRNDRARTDDLFNVTEAL